MKMVATLLKANQTTQNGNVYTPEALQQALADLKARGVIQFADAQSPTSILSVPVTDSRISHKGLEATIEVGNFAEANKVMKMIAEGKVEPSSMGYAIVPKDS